MRFPLSVTMMFLLLLAFTNSVFAQDKPYTPKAASVGTLIQSSSYQESPILLSFEELERKTVVNGRRLDFEHTYKVAYSEILDYFIAAFKEQKEISALRPEVVPHFVVGIAPAGDTARFTLGSKEIPIRFTIDVRPDGYNSVVTVQNAVFSQLFSGIMPARAGYKPTDAKEVSFRWN